MFFNDGLHPVLPTQDAHVCDYNGHIGEHLCIGDVGSAVRGRWLTTKLVYDKRYKQVAKYFNQGQLGAADGHEYNMLPGGRSFLQPVYQKKDMDLSPYAGPVFGAILDGCFQEVEVLTGQEIFHWCFLDHHSIDETYIYLSTPGNTVNLTSPIAGYGTDEWPWDFMHINSIDKNSEGDYLVSARHLDQIIKIAGPNNVHGVPAGQTLWRLGGKQGDFDLFETLFSRQHHARFMSTGKEETVISLFDNAWEGANNATATTSSGKYIAINNRTMHAHVTDDFIHPDSQLALAQGSLQNLPNGNVLLGWGWLPQVTEYNKEGKVLFHAELAENTETPHVGSYRIYKAPWVGTPVWKPKLVAYSRTCKRSKYSPLVAYVSWNGATEVRTWRFYVSVSSDIGPWIPAGSKAKVGFETEAVLLDGTIRRRIPLPFVKYVLVQALDSKGRVLGEATAETFVPGYPANENMCDARGCFQPERFSYGPEYNSAGLCGASRAPGWIAFPFVLLMIETSVWLWRLLLFWFYSYKEGRAWTGAEKRRWWQRGQEPALDLSYYPDSKHAYHDRLTRVDSLASDLELDYKGDARSRRPSNSYRATVVDLENGHTLHTQTSERLNSVESGGWPASLSRSE